MALWSQKAALQPGIPAKPVALTEHRLPESLAECRGSFQERLGKALARETDTAGQ